MNKASWGGVEKEEEGIMECVVCSQFVTFPLCDDWSLVKGMCVPWHMSPPRCDFVWRPNVWSHKPCYAITSRACCVCLSSRANPFPHGLIQLPVTVISFKEAGLLNTPLIPLVVGWDLINWSLIKDSSIPSPTHSLSNAHCENTSGCPSRLHSVRREYKD